MPTKSSCQQLLVIALDAAEPTLIEKWIQDETLPNLKRLQGRGVYTRLASSAKWLAGAPWPTFYTGTSPEKHGLYHWQQWRPDKMKVQIVRSNWLSVDPFWRCLDRKVIALDIPMTYRPRPFNGIEISGWATHDHLDSPASYPKQLMERIVKQYGPSPISTEVYRRQSFQSLMTLGHELVDSVEKVTELARVFLAKEPWDLFMVAYGATHRGGHKLWDETGLSGQADLDHGSQLREKLKAVYMACDRAVGQLVAAVSEEANILIFSLHGMGANTSRTDIMNDMIKGIMGKPSDLSPMIKKTDALQRLRERVPLAFRSKVKDSLPQNWQNWLTRFWVMRRIDWPSIPVVVPDADLQGYLRINLKGREKRGCVPPGKSFDKLCNYLEKSIQTFVDEDSGRPLADVVVSSKKHFGEGARHHLLPDLIVCWRDTPAANHRHIVSSRFGPIDWPTPGRNPSGRSGNHRGEGFLIASGPRISHESIPKADILDLAPSICRLMGRKPIDGMTGRVLNFLKTEP
ncbi:MAG: alkaline phosphatase family protein [Desulfosarcina sp.]|nr:alkaline phosphatase family protein [Desulfobacterales bacterium]